MRIYILVCIIVYHTCYITVYKTTILKRRASCVALAGGESVHLRQKMVSLNMFVCCCFFVSS